MYLLRPYILLGARVCVEPVPTPLSSDSSCGRFSSRQRVWETERYHQYLELLMWDMLNHASLINNTLPRREFPLVNPIMGYSFVKHRDHFSYVCVNECPMTCSPLFSLSRCNTLFMHGPIRWEVLGHPTSIARQYSLIAALNLSLCWDETTQGWARR